LALGDGSGSAKQCVVEMGLDQNLVGWRQVFCQVGGAWWRHGAPNVAKMMEKAWKNGRQVCRLLLAMDR